MNNDDIVQAFLSSLGMGGGLRDLKMQTIADMIDAGDIDPNDFRRSVWNRQTVALPDSVPSGPGVSPTHLEPIEGYVPNSGMGGGFRAVPGMGLNPRVIGMAMEMGGGGQPAPKQRRQHSQRAAAGATRAAGARSPAGAQRLADGFMASLR